MDRPLNITSLNTLEDTMEKGEVVSQQEPQDSTRTCTTKPIIQTSGFTLQQPEGVVLKAMDPNKEEQAISQQADPNLASMVENIPQPRLRLVVKNINKAPRGYPHLATSLDSEYRFMMFRRFGCLQTRLLLYKQDELRELEEQLDALDQDDAEQHKDYLGSRVRDDVLSGKRKFLMGKVDEKFQDYAKLLTTARNLTSFGAPVARDFYNIKRYFDRSKPLCREESYIYHQGDMVALMPSEDSTWLDQVIEKVFQKCHGRVTKFLFFSKSQKPKADPKNGIVVYSARRINVVVTVIVLTMITILFIIPVYIIWRMTRNTTAANSISPIIGVMLAFTVVFSLSLMKLTKAKRHEILAAPAGYCAVLVTFIGNIRQVSSGGSSGAQNTTSS